MAKNDLNFILYKIRICYYGALQKKYRSNVKAFKALFDESVDEEYWRADHWVGIRDNLGANKILANDLCEGKITISGTQFMKENSGMKRVAEFLSSSTESVATLAVLVALI